MEREAEMDDDFVDEVVVALRKLLDVLQEGKTAEQRAGKHTERARHLAVAATLLEGVIGYLETWARLR